MPLISGGKTYSSGRAYLEDAKKKKTVVPTSGVTSPTTSNYDIVAKLAAQGNVAAQAQIKNSPRYNSMGVGAGGAGGEWGVLNDAEAQSIGLPTTGFESTIPLGAGGAYPQNLRQAMGGSAGRVAGVTPVPVGANSKGASGATLYGRTPNSSGAYYGSAGRNIMGTSYGTGSSDKYVIGLNADGRPAIVRNTVDRTAGIPQDPMAQYLQQMQALNPATITDQLYKERRGQLDAIREKYSSQIATEQAAGKEDLARMRSMNLRAGLGGSDFGAANKIETRNQTNKNVAAIQANEDIEIGNAMNNIEQLAQSRFQMQQQALQQGFTNSMQYEQFIQQQQAQARAQAVESIAQLGKSGLDIASIKQRDPQLYESLTQASGMGDVEIEAVLNNSKPPQAKIDYQTIVRGGKVMMFGVDPATNTMKMIEQEVDMPDNYKTLQADDGTILGIPEEWDGDTSKIVTVGNYRKPLASELGGMATGTSGNEYTPGVDPQVDAWASQIQMGKAKLSDITGNPALKSRVVAALDGMSGGQLSAVQNNINEAKTLVDELVTHPGRKFATGVSSFAVNPFSTEAKDFKAKVERLNALLFLNAIPQMRGMGQLTEREGAKLESSSSITRDFGISEDRYLAELKRLQTNLGSAYKNIGGGTQASDGGSVGNIIVAPDGTMVEIID